MEKRLKKFLALFMVTAMLVSMVPLPKAEVSAAVTVPTPLVFYDFKDGLPSDMTTQSNGVTAPPAITLDSERGYVLDLSFGMNGAESYASFPNPFSKVTNLTGATMMLWVKVDPSASFMAYDNLIGFTGTTGRLTLETMPYVCYNADGSWVDLKSTKDPYLSPGVWAHVAVTISDNNVVMYVNGTPITYGYTGSDGDNSVADNTSSMLNFLKTANAYLGNGSFWGTQDCFMDSVSFYDSALTADQVQAAYAADPCVVPADITTGLVSHYSFDNGLIDSVSGNSATEVYGTGAKFGQAITDASTLDYIADKQGKAVSFRGGSNNGIKLPQTITGDDYTISFWMNPTDYVDWSSMIFATGETGNFMNIMGQGWTDDGSHPQISFHKDATDSTAAIDYVSGNTQDKALKGEWTNITYVVDQSDDDSTATLTLYVDGVLQQVFVYPNLQAAGQAITNFYSTNQATMYLGVNWWDPAFNGAIDELYLYNRALSANDVAELHNKGLEVVPVASATPVTTTPSQNTWIPVATPSPTPTPTPTAVPTPTPVIVQILGSNNQATAAITSNVTDGSMRVSVNVTSDNLNNITNELTVPIITDDLINQVSSNNLSEVAINVNVPDSLLTSDNVDKVNINLDADLLKVAAQTGSNVNVVVNDSTGRALYSWNFNGTDLANSKKSIIDVNLTMSVESVADDANITDQSLQDGIVIHFKNEGILPAQTSVKIHVGDLISNTNSSFYLYLYNPTTGTLETLPYSSGYSVDSEGYITVNLIHCSDYVVLPAEADKIIVTSLLDQIKVSPKTKNLYAYKSTSIKVSLPATLELVKSITDKTSSSAVGAVTVSYRSKNSKVATVNSNGKITAVGVGTTTIVTTIHLYNNESKTVSTKITVKKPYIKFTSSTNKMKVGHSFKFTITAYGIDMKNVKWSTTKKSIVEIDKNGKATAKTKGTDYIKVKIGNITKIIKVVVK